MASSELRSDGQAGKGYPTRILPHDLSLFFQGVDLAGQVRFHGGFFFGSDVRLPQESQCAQGHEHDSFPHR